MPSSTILVTGGAGYVGSHTIVELLKAGFSVVVVDNMCNAFMNEAEQIPESLRRVQQLTGRSVAFLKVDIRDRPALDAVFKKVGEGHSWNKSINVVHHDPFVLLPRNLSFRSIDYSH